ncbi:MAG: pilin [bacterium]|nr:pilin [bacterium]
MKSLMRLWAFLLIVSYGATLALPAVALAVVAPFPTCAITITPSVVEAGGSATLTWRSTNATTGAITNIGNVDPNGSRQILPPTTAQITVYVGSFTGPGGTANCVASVQITYGSVTGDTSVTGGTAVNPIVNPNPITPVGTGGSGTQQPSLVQCGTGVGSNYTGATSCEACNLAKLVSNIINFVIGLSIPIAAVLFAWAGILYFTSGARAANMEQAKKIFSSVLIGFLIAITAWLVINTLLHALLDKGKAGFTSGNWFTVRCDTANRPIAVPGGINAVINSVLPGVNTAPPAFGVSNGITYNTATGCALGSAFNPDLGGCVNADDEVNAPILTTTQTSGQTSSSSLCPSGYQYTDDATEYWCQNPNNPNDIVEAYAERGLGRGSAQCSDANTNCSISTLQAQGLTSAQANAMSCIAITENGGNAVNCSGTGPCGTFQISQTNWKQYAPTGCSATNFGGNIIAAQNNAQCNLQTAAIMVNQQGYQPWTGNNNGVYWNPSARTCVSNYDPDNLK